MKRWLCYTLILIVSFSAKAATITWIGGGGDGLWATSANWVGNVVPGAGDDVVLDNSSFAGSYTVTLPNGAINTTINKLAISPNSGNTIRLILPVLNTAAPALTVNQATGDVLLVDNGGILENSNNAGSGTVISITSPGKIRINNGGRYIHNNNLSATVILSNLSLVAGTELGVIEYAQAASSALLSTGVTYNSVELTTTSTRIFSFSGNTAVTFRGFFKINTGITFNSTKNGDIIIAGDLIINGSLNLSPAAFVAIDRRLVFNGSSNQTISGAGNFTFGPNFRNIEVSPGSTVSLQRGVNLTNATNTFIVNNNAILQMGANVINGLGSFQLNSGGWLGIGSAGGITNAPTASGNVQTATRTFPTDASYEYNSISEVPQVTGNGLPTTLTSTFRINTLAGLGTSGVTLSQNTRVDNAFVLTEGKLTTGTPSNLLTLGPASNTTTPYTDNSFVNGPMSKYGNTSYRFPVGKGVNIHTAEVLPASGNGLDLYTVEYFKANPASIYCPSLPLLLNPPIDHISSLEYWYMQCTANSTSLSNQITLNATTYSNATDRSSLVITRCNPGTGNWLNLGNANLLVSGSTGNVTSLNVLSNSFSFAFTLASITALPANPLPITLISFNASKLAASKSSLAWELAACCSSAAKFEVQQAGKNKNFITVGTVDGSATNRFYNYTDNGLQSGINYYRLKMTDEAGIITYSRTVAVMNGVNGLLLTSLMPTVVATTSTLTVASSAAQKMDIVIVDMQGRMVKKQNHTVSEGNTNIQLDMERLAAGVYQIFGVSAEGKTNWIRFIKQ